MILRALLALTVSLAALVPPAALAAQDGARSPSGGPPLAPDHWSYELLEALDVAGAAWGWAHDVRPVGRETVRGELARSARHGFGGGGDVAAAWLGRFTEDHPVGGGTTPDVGEGAGTAARVELRLEAGVRDGRAFLDPGAGAYADIGAAARLGSGVHGWARGAAGGWDRFDGLRSGGLAANLGPFTVMAARQRLRAAGPASASSQIGSGVPLDALYLVSRRPTPFPGFEWLVGPVSWQFALAPWGGLGDTSQGWIGLGGAAAQPHPRLRIGATRSAVFGRSSDAAVTPRRLFRTVFLLQNEPTWWDDQKLELWARVRWELFGQPLASYVVFAQEDSPLYLNSGVLVGTKAARVTGAGVFQLAWEYRGYGPRGQWCAWCERTRHGLTESGREQGQWYHHGPGVLPYARSGVPVGDDTGGYGAQHRLELTHFSAGAALRSRLWAFFQVRDDERNLLHDRWPGKRRGVGVEAAYRLRPGLEVGAAALRADGPRFEAEHGLRAWGAWTWGGGR